MEHYLIPLQEAPALWGHSQTRDTGTGGYGGIIYIISILKYFLRTSIEVVAAGRLAVELRILLTDLLRVLVTCTVTRY